MHQEESTITPPSPSSFSPNARTRKQAKSGGGGRSAFALMMMMFIGTETLVTQLENERCRVHATDFVSD